jgi:hypothetical protein
MKGALNIIGVILVTWGILFYGMLCYSTFKFGHIPQYGIDSDWNTFFKRDVFSIINVLLSSLCLILIPTWILLRANLFVNRVKFNKKEIYLSIGAAISIITFVIAHFFMRNYIGWVYD